MFRLAQQFRRLPAFGNWAELENLACNKMSVIVGSMVCTSNLLGTWYQISKARKNKASASRIASFAFESTTISAMKGFGFGVLWPFVFVATSFVLFVPPKKQLPFTDFMFIPIHYYDHD